MVVLEFQNGVSVTRTRNCFHVDQMSCTIFYQTKLSLLCFVLRNRIFRGGAFAEWDFLRGLREGWMPPIPESNVPSEDLYGSCYDIYNRTNDDYNLIVNEFPDPRTLDWSQWQGWDANDDFVMSDPLIPNTHYGPPQPWYIRLLFPMFLAALVVVVLRRWQARQRRENLGYTELKL